MADTRLILGGVTFRDFEVPEQIRFGQRQRLEIHKQIGGARVIDAMGDDPEDISWKGRFRGKDARSRCNRLYSLAGSGRVVSLAWGGYSFKVVVESFHADYERFYEIPYDINCVVDNNGGFGGFVSSLASLVGADLGSIASIVKGL